MIKFLGNILINKLVILIDTYNNYYITTINKGNLLININN